MRRLLKTGLVQRRNGVFMLMHLGAVVYKSQTVLEISVRNYWKLKAIDSIEATGEMGEQERQKIINVILDDNTVQKILDDQR